MSRKRSRLILTLVVLAAASSGFVSLRAIQLQAQVGEICAAVGESRWADALAIGESAVGADADGRAATECLCRAYVASDQPERCSALLERVLLEPEAAEWMPDAPLAAVLVRARRDSGHVAEAAAFARRAALAHPQDAALLELELDTRAQSESEAEVLADLRRRVTSNQNTSLPLRIVLATAYERRAEPLEAVAVLGESPPPLGSAQLARWFEARADALAAKRDAAGLSEHYARWELYGGDPRELRARHALQTSTWDVAVPGPAQLERLRAALDQVDALANDPLRRALYGRVMARLVADGRVEGALEVFDRAAMYHAGLFRSREEILHRAEQGRVRAQLPVPQSGTLVFALAKGNPTGGTLLVSPDGGAPVDAAYESFPLPLGAEVRIARQRAAHPVRWVLRAADRATLASGTVWPEHAAQRIEIRAATAASPAAPDFDPDLDDGDGRRRVIVVINACEDWRILQYLLARGEAPVQRRALETGHRAVLTSTPAFTGAALESLVWPTRARAVSFVGLANRLGMELEDLSTAGENPLEFLQPILPEGESLFERIGAGERVAANLIDLRDGAERGAERIGPLGERRPGAKPRARRGLPPGDASSLPEPIARSDQERGEVEKLSAGFDAAVALAGDDDIDFLVVRTEPLDRLTHATFAEMLEPGQDDGAAALLWVYRMVDRRLGEIWSELDADDVLVVMSDHGIRTRFEHEEDAIFVAVGGGVPRGRAEGSPHIRGVARYLAALFDIETTWPETGLGETASVRR